MKLTRGMILLALGLFLLCGCSTPSSSPPSIPTFPSTFHREEAMKRLGNLTPSLSPESENLSRSKPPFKLAVYWDMETIDGSGNFFRNRDWDNTEELLMIPFLNQLKKKNIITDYFFLPRNTIPPNDIDKIFTQAERDGATAILCIRAITFIDQYYNPASILDYILIGTVLLPGSNIDAIVLLRCDFWDINTRYLDFSIWAEGSKRTVGPTALISSTPAFKKAKERALYNMMKELNSQIHPSFDIKLMK